MKYTLTAAQILGLLGYGGEESKGTFETMRQNLGLPLPQVYQNFMEAAWNCPLLATGDLWTGQMIPFEMIPRPLYDRLSEAEKSRVCNFLEIGSDYGAGIVTYGLRTEDLTQPDPPVFMQHEAEPVTQWSQVYEKLSDFLLENLLNALTMIEYGTAEEALEELGWQYTDYVMDYIESHGEEEDAEEDAAADEQALTRLGIDPAQVNWRNSVYEGRAFCCYDEESETFYTGLWDGNDENSLYLICRNQEE